MKIFILGSTGMLGHKIFNYLLLKDKYEIINLSRSELNKDTIRIDLRDLAELESIILANKPDVIINCSGMLVKESSNDLPSAVKINSELPKFLDSVSQKYNYKLIHISTDCVFSGNSGPYNDFDFPDPKDHYGKTKASGEINNNHNLTIRTSIIGPELLESGTGLFNWFMKQEEAIDGYTKSIWSGLTTYEVAKAVEYSIINNEVGLKHLSSNSPISKYMLLKIINKITSKKLKINKVDGVMHDKSLIRSNDFFHTENLSYEKLIHEMYEDIELSGLYSHYQL